MSIEIVPLIPELVRMFRPRPDDEHATWYFESLLSGNGDHEAWAVFDEDRFIAMCVVAHNWNGVATILLAFSEDAFVNLLTVNRATKKVLDRIMDGLHRLNAYIRDDRPEAKKWAHVRGFRPEAFLKHFGPNKEDYWLYAIVR